MTLSCAAGWSLCLCKPGMAACVLQHEFAVCFLTQILPACCPTPRFQACASAAPLPSRSTASARSRRASRWDAAQAEHTRRLALDKDEPSCQAALQKRPDAKSSGAACSVRAGTSLLLVLLAPPPNLVPGLAALSPQADDGWKSVHYRGQPLADFRAAYEQQTSAPRPGAGGAAAAAGGVQLAPTRTSGRQRKKKRFDSDSEGEAYGGDALTDEAYAMFLSAAEQQAQQTQPAQQPAAQQQQTVVVELPPGAEVSAQLKAELLNGA